MYATSTLSKTRTPPFKLLGSLCHMVWGDRLPQGLISSQGCWLGRNRYSASPSSPFSCCFVSAMSSEENPQSLQRSDVFCSPLPVTHSTNVWGLASSLRARLSSTSCFSSSNSWGEIPQCSHPNYTGFIPLGGLSKMISTNECGMAFFGWAQVVSLRC